ncbi:hypothetical protein C8R34_12832 [Nitrosomonas sp. Nm84]|uniref:response regulator transcription factor n=1 Tax=Nitrosomonas sp. Nm84 TaxID=200124 RepID=UPI000D90B8BA|nr:response regulator transcription factor [Nitrosomonas sp. Nm84]PXW83470.1 hypothetical protein C8R34_12832 [Nitrosomonas sp. Nm84]
MQPITMAVVEIGQDQQVPVGELLRHKETAVELLTDTRSDRAYTVERRQMPRDGITPVENAIARIKRLNPHILLVNANKLLDEYCDLLLALQYQCPNTQAILVVNEPIEEDYLLKALTCGARGVITNNLDSLDFSKVAMAVHRGEAWLSRKMTGKIMHQIVSAAQRDSSEANLDSLS